MEEAVKEAPSSHDAHKAVMEYTMEVTPISPMLDDDAEERSTGIDETVMDSIKVEEPVPRFVVTTMIPTTIEISEDEEEDSGQVIPDGVSGHLNVLEEEPSGPSERLESKKMEWLLNGK